MGNDMEIKDEKSYIFDKTMKCNVCNKEVTTKQVRTGKARYTGTNDILKPLYTGIDSTKYDIIMCPHCGYAAVPRTYGKLTPKQRQLIRDNIEGKFKVTWKEEDSYSYDVAIRRCKMALLTEMITGTKISESAYLCLRLAWLYDGRIEELRSQNASEEIINQHLKSQQEYIQDAYKGFKEAVQTQYPPICGMDENTINYLLASLGIKCKDYGTAKQFASSIVTSRSAQAGLKEKARGLLGQIKANE